MQTITILNITEGQYVIIACIIIICTRTKPAILVVRNLIVVLQWGNKGGEGEGDSRSGLEYYTLYVHIRVAACLNEAKKGGETSKSKILRILKRGI